MKGAVLSLCRFFPLSVLHMYVELLRFSPAQVTSPLKTRSSLFADCAELVAGVGLFFFFWLFLLPSFEGGVSRRFVSASLPLLRPTHSLT